MIMFFLKQASKAGGIVWFVFESVIQNQSVAEEHNQTGKRESNPLYHIIKHHLTDLLTLVSEETNQQHTSAVLRSFCVSSGLSLK